MDTKTQTKEEVKPTKPVVKKVIKPTKTPSFNFKVFDTWDVSSIQVLDPGLKRYISLRPVLVPFTAGRLTSKQFWKSKKPIVERLVNKMMVTGHKGKKHFRSSGTFSGKKHLAYKNTKEAFKIIEQKTKTNPVEVFVRAIETGSPREGVTTVEYGGNKYAKAVDISPQRRIDLVLRWITQGAFHAASASKSKKSVSQALAEQILLTYDNDNKSNCISKKIDVERTAASSR